MSLIPLPYRILICFGLLLGCLIAGYLYGSHVRGLSDDKALSALQTAQSKALMKAEDTARLAQAQADAATLAQQQAAVTDAQQAASRHAATIQTQADRITVLQATVVGEAKVKPDVLEGALRLARLNKLNKPNKDNKHSKKPKR